MSPLTRRVLGVALWLWLSSFTFLGLDRAIGDGDECIHARILRDMLRTGAWLTPRYQGDLLLERPLLPYWLAAPFASVIPGEVGVRLSSALASLVTLVVVFVVARACWKRADAAFVAVLLLAGSPSFHAYSRTLMSDPPLIASIAIALGSALLAREDPRFLVGVGLGLGLGIACKSLVVGVPGLALAPWLVRPLLRADWRTRARAALALVIPALPYYALMIALHGQQFLNVHFGHSLASRASGNYGIGIAGGTSAYLRWVPETEGPLTTSWLVLGTLGALGYGLLKQRSDRDRDRAFVLLGGYAIGVLALMSLLATRLPHYILPAYPAAALAVGGLWAELSSRTGLDRARFGELLGPLLAMLVLLEGRGHLGGDLYLLQRPWGRDLGVVAGRVTKPGQPLYLYDWNGPSLGYYADRPFVLLTESKKRYEVMSLFVKGTRRVPPAPEPAGSVVYVAGEAPTLQNSAWLKVDQVLAASLPMFLVRGHVVAPAVAK